MPPASTASFTTSTAVRICRHCQAEASAGIPLEDFPHFADCPRLEKKSGHGLEQPAEGRFANSYGERPVLMRSPGRGFISCGHCPALSECARAGACGALIATSAEPGGYDEDDGQEDDLATALRRPRLPEFRVDRQLRTSPHGDPLEADATSVELLEPDPDAPLSFRNFFGGAFGLEAFRGSFEIHPHQRRFIDLMERGERPVLILRQRSSDWPEAFRIVEGLFKEARAPWRRDAEAVENGMGC